jgi:hypothetical protein
MITKLLSIHNTTEFSSIDLEHFYSEIKNANYKNEVDFYRLKFTELGKKGSEPFKQKIPAVVISGTFNESVKNANLVDHSGYICVDVDNIESNNINELKLKLRQDKYIESYFTSCGGVGLAVIIKIDPSKHLESFLGLEDYFFNTYNTTIDKSCKNVSRLRFYSYDSDIYINKKSKVFKQYIKPIYNKKEVVNTVLTGTEFDELMTKIISSGRSLAEDYDTYLKIGFALADEFGESGRQYFHAISSMSSKYDQKQCDRQYTHCISAGGSKKIKIGTLYYFCKINGIELKSKESKFLEVVSKKAKSDGRSRESVVEIAKISGLNEDKAKEVAAAIFDNNVNLNTSGEESKLMKIMSYINSNYQLYINSITRNLENRAVIINGRPQKFNDFDLNSAYLKFDESFPKSEISQTFFQSAIFSNEIPHYNPFEQFFNKYSDVNRSTELITKLANCIESETPNVEKWIKHWGCGLISSIYGKSSPLVLVLAGGQNSGKTEFFRRLLPFELQEYYAESKLDAGKDDDILMCKKLIIMDDEFGGKSKKENKRFKELTSKHTFSIRAPYGRVSEDLTRLAALCGTTNDFNLLDDPTGNRRILPINVKSINHGQYNEIDKCALFMAFYDLFKSGFNWNLSHEDIKELNEGSDEFQSTNMEAELILSYLAIPDPNLSHEGVMMTNTEIKNYLETWSKQKIFSTNKLGMELKSLGFQQQVIKYSGKAIRVYFVKKLDINQNKAIVNDTYKPF